MSAAGDLVIGFDVGGTKVAAVVLNDEGNVIARDRVPTPADDDGSRLVEVLATLATDLRGRYPEVSAIGVGCAGLIEYPSGRVVRAANNAYENLELRALLEERTGLPVAAENDVNAAVLGEASAGAGKGYGIVTMIAPGTGIGGGLSINGELFRGGKGLGIEIGHIPVVPEGPICGCGNKGCLESYASGTALRRMGREASEAGKADHLLELAGGSADKITGEVIAQAAAAGDAEALEIFDVFGYWLGIGMATMVNLLDPDVIVVGGGIAELGDLIFDRIHPSFDDHIFGVKLRDMPPIVPATLGPEAGVIGAAFAARSLTPSTS